MNDYEQQARFALKAWESKIMKPSNAFVRTSKSIQNLINHKIPQRFHDMITESIKKMIQTVLVGSKFTTKRRPYQHITLKAREDLVKERINQYKKVAATEGAGTGAGGILWGLADFPMLLTIKMKFLFDAASIYGFDVKDYRERLYILYLFQLTYSSDEKRMNTYVKIKNWQHTVQTFPSKQTYLNQLDWQSFQQEYRDHMDLVKLLQMVPGFGAVVGAWANYRFLNELGETAMNGYRLRLFKSPDNDTSHR